MSNDDFSPEFYDLLDALTIPTPSPSDVLRVAEMHYGAPGISQAIEAAGIKVAATLDGQKQLPDFEVMPDFDVVVANVSADPKEWEGATDYAMRFLRVRRPVAFVILGCVEEELRRLMLSKCQPYGYDVSSTREDDLNFIAGVSERASEESAWEGLQAVARRVRDEITRGS